MSTATVARPQAGTDGWGEMNELTYPPDMPPMPEGVVIVTPDGTEIPVDCHYSRQTEDGVHVWQVLPIPGVVVSALRVRLLPGKTSVELTLEDSSE